MLSVGWPQATRLASRRGTRSAFLAQSGSKNVSTRSYNSSSTNASRRSISTRELAVPSRSANLLRLLPTLHFMTKRTFHSSRTTRDDNTDEEAQAGPQTISLSKVSMNLHADPRAVCYVAEVFTFATLYDTGKVRHKFFLPQPSSKTVPEKSLVHGVFRESLLRSGSALR
jgi:hypothetical protein